MALHDAAIQAAVDDLYDGLMEKVVQLLRRSQPNDDETSIREMYNFGASLGRQHRALRHPAGTRGPFRAYR